MENTVINTEKAKELLDGGLDKAKELLKSNDEVNKLIDEVQQKVKETPLLGQAVADLPVMIDMVKSYITKEYDVVSPKVIATIVSAFLYLITRKDLIKDTIPVLGQLDDIAVVVLAINFIGPELKEYTKWKETGVKPEKTAE
ncbi:MAG: DUF1232 domain-containing protein [Erysipelotrichaceae bacterium]|nr:DUF1232 domain-containing protein [Erysipelotrichaceae bacterium]